MGAPASLRSACSARTRQPMAICHMARASPRSLTFAAAASADALCRRQRSALAACSRPRESASETDMCRSRFPWASLKVMCSSSGQPLSGVQGVEPRGALMPVPARPARSSPRARSVRLCTDVRLAWHPGQCQIPSRPVRPVRTAPAPGARERRPDDFPLCLVAAPLAKGVYYVG
jgi:hypothetical protein